MYFKEEDKLVNYSIAYKDRDEVARITLERLKNLKSETIVAMVEKKIGEKASLAKQMPKYETCVICDRNGLHLDSSHCDSFTINDDRVSFSTKRKRISSDVPFSIGVGQYALSRETLQCLESREKAYLTMINKINYIERLSNVLHCDTNQDTIYKISKMLEKDPKTLKAFYKEYQKDLLAFKELLSLIELAEVSRVSFDEQKNRVDSLIQEKNHILARFDLNTSHPKTSHSGYHHALGRLNSIDNEIGSLPSQLNLALENTDVAKKLNLQFKKR